MCEDHTGGKMPWQKPGLVALEATSSSGQNIVGQMQETEEPLMDCGPRLRI